MAIVKQKETTSMTFNKETKRIQKILVIEDEADMCLLLDHKSISIDHVHTLTDAKEFLDEEQPSLILLDNRLPDGYGRRNWIVLYRLY